MNATSRKKLIIAPYYGGKFSHLRWLLPLLPECFHYVEPFAGSGAVLLNRRPSPIETLNDADQRIVNLFRVLRDRPDEFVHAVTLTPYSRAEQRLSGVPSGDDIEDARRMFSLLHQSRGSIGDGSGWRFVRGASRRGMSLRASAVISTIDGLEAVVTRLRRVQLDCDTWENVIARYDSLETFFYCDPPYLEGGEAYPLSLAEEDHVRLLEQLRHIEGRAAISGYPSELYDEMLVGWHRHEERVRKSLSSREEAIECLWMNYEPAWNRSLFGHAENEIANTQPSERDRNAEFLPNRQRNPDVVPVDPGDAVAPESLDVPDAPS